MPKEFLWMVESGEWPDIYVAIWSDPSSEIQKVWMSPQEVGKVNPLKCIAVGFLVERTKTAIKLASSVCANGHSGQVITIPIKTLTWFDKLADVGKDVAKKIGRGTPKAKEAGA